MILFSSRNFLSEDSISAYQVVVWKYDSPDIEGGSVELRISNGYGESAGIDFGCTDKSGKEQALAALTGLISSLSAARTTFMEHV
jgi:hypothetical protein